MHLVIPSYEKHIHWNEKFLKSFNKFCADKSDVEITFIGNQSNVDLFKGLTRKFKKLNVRIQTLTHLIQSVDQVYFDDSPLIFQQNIHSSLSKNCSRLVLQMLTI